MKKCKAKDCGNVHFGKGYCGKHYTQIRKHGRLVADRPMLKGKVCSIGGCDARAYCKMYCIRHYQQYRKYGAVQPDTPRIIDLPCIVNKCGINREAGDYCSKHRAQMMCHGKILERTRYDPNTTRTLGSATEIDLRNHAGEISGVALIDTKDAEQVLQHVWCLLKIGYAKTSINGQPIYLHKFLRPAYEITDHISGDKLDNRGVNLREVTASQSAANTKPRQNKHVKGVLFHKASNTWYAYTRKNNKHHSGGYYKKYEDAVMARRKLVSDVHGKYAYEARP